MPRKIIVHLNVDGASEHIFYNALADGKLPAFKEAFDGGMRTKGCVSIAPSTTIPAQTSIITGCWPRKTHVHSFRLIRRYDHPPSFFNFEDLDNALGYYGYRLFGFPDILMPKVSDVGTVDERINPSATTIYEDAAHHGLTSKNVFHLIMRGATKNIVPSKGSFLKYALAHEGFGSWRAYDQDVVIFGLRDLEENGLADVNTYYLAGLDASGHYVGGNKEQENYLVKDVEAMWADLYRGIQRAGRGDDILFVLTSDHGHGPYVPDEAHAVSPAKMVKAFTSYGYKVLDEKDKPTNIEPYDLVICSGLGKLLIYIRAKDGSWMMSPDFERDVLPVAKRLFDTQGYFGNYLGHMLVKDRSEGVYKILDFTKGQGELVDMETWYADKKEMFPKAVERMNGLYYMDSPDLVVFADDDNGYHFSDHPHHSGHGSLHKSCSLVPAMMAGDGVEMAEISGATILDVLPTAANWAGFSMPNAQGTVWGKKLVGV